MMRAAILGLSGPVLTQEEARFFADAQPWGFILFGRNIDTPDRLQGLCADLRAALGRDAPILIDQEGGRVQRMRAPHWREFAPPLDEVARLDADAGARALYLRGALIGAELAEMGIDVNCAPLADVARPQTHAVLRNRLYGDDPVTVARNARAMAQGLMDAGVVPVVKHLPGYGLGQVDSHLSLPVVDASAEVLRAVDFAAFRPLTDLPLGMTAHITYRAIDPDRPATLSPVLMAIIRQEIGFDGLLMTDDISMGALGGTIAARSRDAIAAGCDVILHCNGARAEMDEVLTHCGELDTERAAKALVARTGARALDIGALAAEFQALTQ